MAILIDKRYETGASFDDSDIEYPDSDGKPMADNTLQFEWITVVKEGCEALFASDPDVFVAGDLLWYPVQGNNKLRQAPDAMVAFGRPKGYRSSYRQWEENNIAPQVAFEILSPGNRAGEMAGKAAFYERHGIEEYYIYDPDRKIFSALVRSVVSGFLEDVPLPMDGFTSPRLGVRFDMTGDDLLIIRPDGEPFKTYGAIFAERNRERDRANRAERERDAVTSERNTEAIRADAATAERDAATAERDAATARAERLASLLREAGIEPD